MKRFLKYACVWLVLMIGIVAIIGRVLPEKISESTLTPVLSGYAEKMAFPVEAPADETEEKQIGGMLMMRSILSDSEYKGENDDFAHFSLENYNGNESYVFLNPQGAHDFSYGTYAYAYHDAPEEEARHTAHPVGLIDLGAFTMLDGASALREAMAAHPDAVVRLDAYTVQDYLVQPAKITLTDDAGQVLFTQEFSAEGDIIQAEDCRIYNNYDSEDLYSGLYGKLRYVHEGDHSAAAKAAAAAKDLLNGKTVSEENKTGTGKISRTVVYQSNGYQMVYASVVQWPGVQYYIVMAGVIMTCVLTAAFFIRNGRKQAES